MFESKNTVGLFLLGLLICIGLVATGLVMGRAVFQFKAAERYVTVKGLAEREVDADLVIWPVSFADTGNDLAALHDRVESKQQSILAFLEESGIRDGEISVNPPVITDF